LKPALPIYILQNDCSARLFVSREPSVFSLRGPPCM
jgi:hypothetical protein